MTSLVTGELVLSETFVESRSGGKNFAAYTEHGGGFPDAWANSTAKSTAPGVTAGIGSRFNSTAGFGAWFEVSPTLPTAGGVYDIYVTTTGASGAITATTDVTVTGGTGLAATTTAFGTESQNTWALVGTLTLNSGVSAPTIRFAENTHSNRFYADGVAFVEAIPEPSTLAAIFGGLALLGAFVYRRRMSVKKQFFRFSSSTYGKAEGTLCLFLYSGERNHDEITSSRAAENLNRSKEFPRAGRRTINFFEFSACFSGQT